MKRYLTIITALAMILCGLSVSQAQTDKASLLDDFKPLLSASNWTAVAYGTYAPDAPEKIGGGLLCVYNLNDYVGGGLGVDWLGQFNLVTGNLTLRYPIPFDLLGRHIVATPFGIGAVGTALGGAGANNGGVSTVEGAGVTIHGLLPKNIGIGGAYVNWTGAGDYSGKHYEAFLSYRF